MSKWNHGLIDKAEAEKRLKGKGNGGFLIRDRPAPDEHVLSLVYKNKPSHHIIAKRPADGVFTVNNKPYVPTAKTLDDLVNALQEPVKGWPQPLTDGALPPGASEPAPAPAPTPAPAPEPAAAAETPAPSQPEPEPQPEPQPEPEPQQQQQPSEPEPTPAPEPEPAVVVAAEQPAYENLKPGSVNAEALAAAAADPANAFFHGVITKAEAEERLGQSDNGVYLIRARLDNNTNEYVVSVIHKNKPSHHLVTRESAPGDFILNNKTPLTGCNTLSLVLEHLRSSHPYWPLMLKDGVAPQNAPAAAQPQQEQQQQAAPADPPAPAVVEQPVYQNEPPPQQNGGSTKPDEAALAAAAAEAAAQKQREQQQAAAAQQQQQQQQQAADEAAQRAADQEAATRQEAAKKLLRKNSVELFQRATNTLDPAFAKARSAGAAPSAGATEAPPTSAQQDAYAARPDSCTFLGNCQCRNCYDVYGTRRFGTGRKRASILPQS